MQLDAAVCLAESGATAYLSEEIEYVALHPDTGGRFEIFCNGVQIWERKQEGGFPEAKVLKQRVRDLIDPERDLGHVDRPSSTQS